MAKIVDRGVDSPGGLVVELYEAEVVARGVVEPGDVVTGTVKDTPPVLLEPGVPLEHDSTCLEVVDGGLDVVDGKVEDREGRRLVVWLRVHERTVHAVNLQPEWTAGGQRTRDVQTENFREKRSGGFEVGDRETGEGSGYD